MKTSEIVFKLKSGHKHMTKITIYNVQRGITLKVGKQELRFSCSACCLKVLYISIKFHENMYLKHFQVAEWTQFCDGQMDRLWEKQFVSSP